MGGSLGVYLGYGTTPQAALLSRCLAHQRTRDPFLLFPESRLPRQLPFQPPTMPPTDPQTQQSSRSSAKNNPRSNLRKRVLDLNTLAYVLVLVFVILILRHHLIQNETLRLFFVTRLWSSLTQYISGHRTLGISYGSISKIVNVQYRATLGDLFFYVGSWCNHHIRFIMTIPSALLTTRYSLAKVILPFISSLTHIPSPFLDQLSLKRVLIAIFYAIQNWLIPVIKLAMICIATSIIACTTISESFISQVSPACVVMKSTL